MPAAQIDRAARRVDEQERAEADEQHRPERGADEVVRAALGEQQRHQQPADDRRPGERERGAPVGSLRVVAEPRARRRSRAPRRTGRRRRPGSPRCWRARARAAAIRDRRAHAQAPTASAIPSVNGIRPITTLLITPPRNSHDASAALPGVGASRRASMANSPTATTAATTPTSRVPSERGERRVQQRVAGHVVAAVPLGVPRGEADLVPEPGAVGVRGHVRRLRGGDQVRDAHGGGGQRGDERMGEAAAHRGPRTLRCRLRALRPVPRRAVRDDARHGRGG